MTAPDVPKTADELASRLASLASNFDVDLLSEEFAKHMDDNDEFKHMRSEFNIAHAPKDPKQDSIYMCGNSLGLQPRKAADFIQEEMSKWALEAVEGHFHGDRPWVTVDEPCVALSTEIVGAAKESEIAIMNTLSCNLHLLLAAFYRPSGTRRKIVIESGAFCSDQHVVRSQIAFHGGRVDEDLVELAPREGEHTLRTEDVCDAIRQHGSSIAVVLLSGVQFRTGQFFDIERITAVTHEVGAISGWDLAHAAGNVPLQLHAWQVDFAAWCSYKYLNSGPGATAGVFLHERHAIRKDLLHFAGWWGQTPETRFKMMGLHEFKPGAQRFQLSNPAVLPTVCLQASLEVFRQAGGVNALRRKSVLLTGWLYALLEPLIQSSKLHVLTPSDPKDRGCQLSLLFPEDVVDAVQQALMDAGAIVDVRRPGTVRVAPTPLYNTFQDCWRFVQALRLALAQHAA